MSAQTLQEKANNQARNLTEIRENIRANRERLVQENKAYRLITQGFEILATLADQKGPGQAAVYRFKIDGYTKAIERNNREIAELDEILA